MSDSELVAKAVELARPCVLLKKSGAKSDRAGVWGGPGLVAAPSGPYRHWISVDCSFFPVGLAPRSGILSVYTNEDDCSSGVVAHDPAGELPARANNTLYAHPARSLPPPDALTGADSESYMRVWQSNCPLYTGEAVAVLGGWHFPWPDGDWDELRARPLLLWTIEDSEPWVEVWGGAGGFQVMQRIT